jgi:hypothetical protein
MAGAEAAAGAAIAAAAAMGAWLGAAAAAGRAAFRVGAVRWEATKVSVSVEFSTSDSLGLVSTGAAIGSWLTTGALRESRRGAALFLSVVPASSLSAADSAAAPRADLRG